MPQTSPLAPLNSAAATPELAGAIAEHPVETPKRATRLLLAVPRRRRHHVLRCLEQKHPEALHRILKVLPADDLSRLLHDLRRQPKLLEKLHPERRREAESLLALFLPLVISSGGNSGSQGSTLLILRGTLL
jgi:Mg/Co/Ni transporter MgtE